ncbi:hypothetical protein BJV74DRAFT_351374 [Russula compacta]|nr:hypothetical protein BJV74DRAFT_351374 [Russula compacta]
MHLFLALPVLNLLFGARASLLDSRSPAPHPLDVRDTVDVCGLIDVQGGPLSGEIKTCLCLSDVPDFITTDPIASQAVAIYGPTEIIYILKLAINGGQQQCGYPASSIPTCSNGSPCGFQCTDGLTPFPEDSPTSCECQPPSTLCNGQCMASAACPSSAVPDRKRRWVGSGSCAEMGPEWTACGVFGGAARAWECVNTAHDLESCGGCVLPLTPFSPAGIDCTELPGVADVACMSGQCVVRRCLPGYALAFDGTSCTPKHSRISHSHIAGLQDEIEFVPARIFGLEHVPLERN